MLKRTISGSVYVAILVAFFLLRQFCDYRIFHVLTCFFLIVGTIELAKALKERIFKWTFYASIIFAILFVPIYILGEYVIFDNSGYLFCLDFSALMIIATCIYSIITSKENKQFLCSILPYIYPALFLLTMLLANDLGDNGFIALLLAFVVSPCSDTFAYLVGSMIKGKKLCPKLSPKKTWSGAIGGTIGGIISSLLVYIIFMPQVNFFSPVLLFAIIGLIASILNIFGDLFESYIKRKVGIKDMGKIMPGHGGVLDRIDGTMFAMASIYLIFLFV